MMMGFFGNLGSAIMDGAGGYTIGDAIADTVAGQSKPKSGGKKKESVARPRQGVPHGSPTGYVPRARTTSTQAFNSPHVSNETNVRPSGDADPRYDHMRHSKGFTFDPTSPTGWSYSNGVGGISHPIAPDISPQIKQQAMMQPGFAPSVGPVLWGNGSRGVRAHADQWVPEQQYEGGFIPNMLGAGLRYMGGK
jgi:hypothetical protein